ncbi:fasciclin domain-containing protein [Breznakiella homolactica]|uniref:Fasciclin domain-containing protein n=1 Tax=Breznakiella homolactica TaxID=2798577 RepID=A0A7T7XLS5_9SPIR|nr:fasciclin domain-containing protein [Breznakiella homolactica]QQO08730.1 fasciclin domain-containing protein [Breznakiella homolactica]
MKKLITKIITAALIAGTAAGIHAQEFGMPRDAVTIGEMVSASVDCTQLVDALDDHVDLSEFTVAVSDLADEVDILADAGGITVFAPVNEAVEDTTFMDSAVADYIVPGTFTIEALQGMESLTALSGKELSVEAGETGVTVNGIALAADDSITSQGIIINKLAGTFEETLLTLR